jgi:hypothetical protein
VCGLEEFTIDIAVNVWYELAFEGIGGDAEDNREAVTRCT